MNTTDFKLIKYSDTRREQLLDVWERSVLATHDFLSFDDFQSIKKIVRTIDFNAFDVYCLTNGSELAGFVGVAEQKVEMLFLAPLYLGKGLGARLLKYAIADLKADKVDVNEQNIRAVTFYRKFGFTTYERTEKDDQGKNYPLLRMKCNTLLT